MISKVQAQAFTLHQRILINKSANESRWLNFVMLVSGVLLLSALAQVSIPLPFTPVPITGQSLGVLVIAMLLGARLGTLTTLSYLGLGASGLPVFADFKSGLAFPSLGYLLGMLAATYVVGNLADRGWTKSFKGALAASFIGKILIFSFGLLVLSFFVPAKSLLLMGLYPFIPGLFIKAILAALIASSLTKSNAKI